MNGENVEIVSYLALGVLFATVASLALRRKGWRGIAVVTSSAVVVLLVIGIWLVNKEPPSEGWTIGPTILLALLPPSLAAAFVWAPAKRDLPIVLQCVMGAVGWVAGGFTAFIAGILLSGF